MNPLTEQEKETIIALFESGLDSEAISKITGRSYSGVYHFLKKSGYAPNKKDIGKEEGDTIISLFSEGESVSEIADVIPKKKHVISEFLKRNGFNVPKRITDEDETEVVRIYLETNNLSKTSSETSHSIKTIKRILEENNIEVKKPFKTEAFKERIVQEYITTHKSCREIADENFCCAETVRKILKENGIETIRKRVPKTNTEKKSGLCRKEYSTQEKETIIRLYTEEGCSCKNIAEKLNKSKNGINCFLKRSGIEMRSNSISENETLDIITLFTDGLNCHEIAKLTNRSVDGICGVLKRNGYETSRDMLKRLPEDDIKQIISRYSNGETTCSIAEDYQVCDRTIAKIITHFNIEMRRRGAQTHIEREDFFHVIDSEQKAYILGYLIADGYVIYPRRKSPRSPVWGITLQSCDKYMLERFKEIIGITKALSFQRNEYVLLVSSKQMVDDLAQYKIVPRKCRTITFPFNVDKSLYRHIIRGIFDGDGCISGKACSFSGNNLLLPQIQEILIKDLNINRTKMHTNMEDVTTFYFSSKQDVFNFYHYLYDGASIYLTRKYERFKKLDFII